MQASMSRLHRCPVSQRSAAKRITAFVASTDFRYQDESTQPRCIVSRGRITALPLRARSIYINPRGHHDLINETLRCLP
jgi:hypothetical protein